MTNIVTRERTPADDLKIADVTVEAVDQIGATAAQQIEALAKQLRDSADDIAKKLLVLADGMRETTKVASEHVAEFCGQARSIHQTIYGLQAELNDHNAKDPRRPSNGAGH